MTTASKPRALLAWSSGKDSAWALHVLRDEARVEVAGLLTTVDLARDRVPMHAVPRELLRAQARAAGLPLVEVGVPEGSSNADYETAMRAALERARSEGVSAIAFGDLFLEDVRRYREERLAEAGFDALFPLWGRDTRELAHEMIEGGLVAHLTSVDLRRLPAALCGRRFDESLLAALPAGADPCGERGEFHSFVSAGPMLAGAIEIEIGEAVERDGFVHRPPRAASEALRGS